MPQINGNLFRKSPSKEEHNRNSGFYDLEQAQHEYDRSSSLPNSVYVNSDTSTDSDDENFEDARTSDKNSNFDQSHSEDDFLDSEIYADVSPSIGINKNVMKDTLNYEYDVPKISFSFFDKNRNNTTQNMEKNEYCNEEKPVLLKTEVKIILNTPLPETFNSKPQEIKTETLEILPVVGILKCGSDPNLASHVDESDDEENFYKTPRKLTPRCRLSQSLSDFNIEEFQPIASDHSSIEHVSCSQVIVKHVQETQQEPPTNSGQNSESMDYCKVRSRLPLRIRRPTFLRKPRKAVDTWNHFRSKFNNIMAEQAAQQRVGAYEEKEKVAINFEGMYKNSKTKCKNAFKNTTKMFKRQQDSSLDSDTSSQIVKNDAFFAKVPITPNDIEYKFNYNSELQDNKVACDSSATSADVEEEKREFDFSTIKSAFRRSKYMAAEVRKELGFRFSRLES